MRLFTSVLIAALYAVGHPLAAQVSSPSGPQSTYRLVEGWAQLPPGVEAWGQTIGVEMDGDGNLLVFHRCFATSCARRDSVPAVLKYDPSGALIDSWGAGLFIWPHGSSLDPDGNLWTTDALGLGGRGHQAIKLDPEGQVLMRLGTAGVAGDGPNSFDGPTDVAVAPNGDIFVADGHGNSRVVRFSKDGEFEMSWGTKGTGPGEFDEPHALAFDSRGRLFVGDRLNQRIQVFDQNGRFLDEWTGIMASGMHITPDDQLFVADYQLRMGIVIADAADLSETGFIPSALGEGVTVDALGNVYVGEVIPRNLKKFERIGGPPARGAGR